MGAEIRARQRRLQKQISEREQLEKEFSVAKVENSVRGMFRSCADSNVLTRVADAMGGRVEFLVATGPLPPAAQSFFRVLSGVSVIKVAGLGPRLPVLASTLPQDPVDAELLGRPAPHAVVCISGTRADGAGGMFIRSASLSVGILADNWRGAWQVAKGEAASRSVSRESPRRSFLCEGENAASPGPLGGVPLLEPSDYSTEDSSSRPVERPYSTRLTLRELHGLRATPMGSLSPARRSMRLSDFSRAGKGGGKGSAKGGGSTDVRDRPGAQSRGQSEGQSESRKSPPAATAGNAADDPAPGPGPGPGHASVSAPAPATADLAEALEPGQQKAAGESGHSPFRPLGAGTAGNASHLCTASPLAGEPSNDSDQQMEISEAIPRAQPLRDPDFHLSVPTGRQTPPEIPGAPLGIPPAYPNGSPRRTPRQSPGESAPYSQGAPSPQSLTGTPIRKGVRDVQDVHDVRESGDAMSASRSSIAGPFTVWSRVARVESTQSMVGVPGPAEAGERDRITPLCRQDGFYRTGLTVGYLDGIAALSMAAEDPHQIQLQTGAHVNLPAMERVFETLPFVLLCCLHVDPRFYTPIALVSVSSEAAAEFFGPWIFEGNTTRISTAIRREMAKLLVCEGFDLSLCPAAVLVYFDTDFRKVPEIFSNGEFARAKLVSLFSSDIEALVSEFA